MIIYKGVSYNSSIEFVMSLVPGKIKKAKKDRVSVHRIISYHFGLPLFLRHNMTLKIIRIANTIRSRVCGCMCLFVFLIYNNLILCKVMMVLITHQNLFIKKSHPLGWLFSFTTIITLYNLSISSHYKNLYLSCIITYRTRHYLTILIVEFLITVPVLSLIK